MPTKNRAFGAGAFVPIACGVIISACSSTVPAQSGSWPYPNGDIANMRDASGSTISSVNVSKLKQAWTFKLTGATGSIAPQFGSFAAGPVVQDGTVYIQDLRSNVYALDLATGTLRWKYEVNAPTLGPNGVAVANGEVYGDSPTSVFALSAATGQLTWELRIPSGFGLSIQPQVVDGRIYVATTAAPTPGGGLLLAFNASNGHPLWTFKTVPGTDSNVQGAGGAWETPLVSSDGSVTYGTGNPYQSAAAAIADPSKLLYTDSEVNLNAATGKLRWYYQAVSNDFQDLDLQASPIAADVGGLHMVIGAGKMGDVYAMTARTGTLLWRTQVGEHNGSDNDPLLAMEHRLNLVAPYTTLPGVFGGVLSNMALAGHDVYVTVCNVPYLFTSLNQVVGRYDAAATSNPSGEVVALNVATGKEEWDTKVEQMPLGAATVSNDLVFTTLYNGVLLALNRNTGAIVFRHKLPTSTNAPIAIAGKTLIVPAGGPYLSVSGHHPQLVAYAVS